MKDQRNSKVGDKKVKTSKRKSKSLRNSLRSSASDKKNACEVSKTVNFEENDYSPTPSRLQERSASDVPPLTKPLLEPLVLQSSSTLGKVDIAVLSAHFQGRKLESGMSKYTYACRLLFPDGRDYSTPFVSLSPASRLLWQYTVQQFDVTSYQQPVTLYLRRLKPNKDKSEDKFKTQFHIDFAKVDKDFCIHSGEGEQHEEKKNLHFVQQRVILKGTKGFTCAVTLQFHNFDRKHTKGFLLEQLLCYNNRFLQKVLELSVCSETSSSLLHAIYFLIKGRGLLKNIVQKTVKEEIDNTDDIALLFRNSEGNINLLRIFMMDKSTDFMLEMLKKIRMQMGILFWGGANIACELDPNKAESTEAAKEARKNVLEASSMIFKAIFEAASLVTPELKHFFAYLKPLIVQKFPSQAHVGFGGLFFLRLVCPALLSPRAYGANFDFEDRKTKRLFMLVVKVIQQLANDVLFGDKEAYMTPMNSFLKSYRKKVLLLYRRISDIEGLEDTDEDPSEIPDIVYEKLREELHDKLDTLSQALKGSALEEEEKLLRLGLEQLQQNVSHRSSEKTSGRKLERVTSVEEDVKQMKELCKSPSLSKKKGGKAAKFDSRRAYSHGL